MTSKSKFIVEGFNGKIWIFHLFSITKQLILSSKHKQNFSKFGSPNVQNLQNSVNVVYACSPELLSRSRKNSHNNCPLVLDLNFFLAPLRFSVLIFLALKSSPSLSVSLYSILIFRLALELRLILKSSSSESVLSIFIFFRIFDFFEGV